MADRLTDLPQLDPDAPPIVPRALERTLVGALVGGFGGFLVGFLASRYVCSIGDNNCLPIEELKVALVTAAGLLVGVLVSRLWRSMTKDRRIVMVVAISILLAVLIVACYHRYNHWYCPPDAFCQVGDAVMST